MEKEATKEQIKETVEAFKKSNKDRFEEIKNAHAEIRENIEENKPVKPVRPELSDELKAQASNSMCCKEMQEAQKKSYTKTSKEASKEERKEQIAEFKEANQEKHQEIEVQAKAIKEEIREFIETDAPAPRIFTPQILKFHFLRAGRSLVAPLFSLLMFDLFD